MIFPNQESLAAIQTLYDRGLLLQAFRAAEALGPLTDWRGPEARVLAGRLAGMLEARRRSDAIMLEARREHPEHPLVNYFYVWALYHCRGPLPAWQALEAYKEPDDVPARLRADFEALRGEVRAEFRDFDAAAAYIARAEALAPESAWIYVEKARVLGNEDRYEEALAAAQHALELRPWYTSAVNITAHFLQLAGRDEEALALLGEAVTRLESGALVSRLAEIEEELGRFASARAHVDRLPELWPLMEAPIAKWLACKRADLAYYCGDYAAARTLGAGVGTPFHSAFAEALAAAPPAPRRVHLKVDFVRQHYLTCGPATLSALAKYWSVPVDHLEVAEEICYTGTTDVSERRWALAHGFVARHFRLTWDSAVALLDRGVPFAVSTVETGDAHLQAVIGYDAARATFLLRDPTIRKFGEFYAPEMLERYAPTGPCATALVPAGKAELLAGIALPDAELYDARFEVECALKIHDRDAAEASVRRMERAHPGHRLTLQARASIAGYDSDPATKLACLERTAAEFPNCGHLLLARGRYMRQLGRAQEYHDMLRVRAEEPGADPVIVKEYIDVLRVDARELSRALERMTWVLRRRRLDGSCYHILGDILADLRRREEALAMYRIAACMEDKDEHYAWACFAAARHLRRTDEALAFLTRRFERYGGKASGPVKTLFDALAELDRDVEAFAALERGLARRPDDGDLLLYAADAFARFADFTRAEELRARARGKCRPADWLRTAAKAAHLAGDLKGSLDLWRQVLALEPLAVDAHRAVAARLEETAGRAEAIAHLAEATARFVHNHALLELLIEWLRDEHDHAACEEAARRLCALDPTNAWARRELALALSRQLRHEEALVQVDKSASSESRDIPYRNVKGAILSRAGRRDEAEATLERIAPHLDADDAASRKIELLTHRKALADAEREFSALLARTDAGHWSIENAARALHAAGSRSLDALIATALRDERAPKSAAAFYVQRLLQRGQRRRARRLLRDLPYGSAVWKAAADAYLRAIGYPRTRRAVTAFVRRFRAALMDDNALWGLAGWALTNSNAHRRCVRWMGDYRTRQDVKSWMLSNIADSLRYLGRDEEGYAVSEYALALPFNVDSPPSAHEGPLAIEDLFAHRFDLARTRLGRVNRNDLNDLENFALDLGDALLGVERDRGAVPAARRRMAERIARERGSFQDGLKRRYARRAMRSLARLAGDPITWLWAAYRCVRL